MTILTLAELLALPWLTELCAAGAVVGVILALWGMRRQALAADRRRDEALSLGAAIEAALREHGLDLHAGDPERKVVDLAMYARLAEVPDPRALHRCTPEEIHRCYDSCAQKDPVLAGKLTRAALLSRRRHEEDQRRAGL